MPSVTSPTPNHWSARKRFPPTTRLKSAAKAMLELKRTA